ncbi:hypothetical protein [Idiomarina aminovorans]|uniref:hypothetical protein n=1 Tax=Idiomarina aminovorans TaxID=2914829 RepID=UPI0020055561|nr:hypothetical protein [Idiomarina sp. ATCH4]MCK7458350.1 hypothetical protein [Idiomarina sp. ATCH4]
MKLANVLSTVNQFEKSKFINFLDRICTEVSSHDIEVAKRFKNIDGQIKNASSGEVTQLFKLAQHLFQKEVKSQLALSGAQTVLLVNILSRDGNCVARITWIEHLCEKEWKQIDEQAKSLKSLFADAPETEVYDEPKRLGIYYACLHEALHNDERSNREAKITDEERGILNVLAQQLDVTADNRVAIEHLIDPIPKTGVQDCLNQLREIGIVFVSKKDQTVYIPDEIVAMLHRIQHKELADKHLLRILRTFSDAELSNILKNHDKRIRGVSRDEKIDTVFKMGLSVSQILSDDMHNEQVGVTEKKDRLKLLIEDLQLSLDKLGTTLDERYNLIIGALNSSTEREFNILSAAGYKSLFATLSQHMPKLPEMLKSEFELEPHQEIDVEKLRSLAITPYDILFMLSNEQVKSLKSDMDITRRGDPRQVILESFADATDKLVENYEALAKRDWVTLKQKNIEIAEADIGVKFEEVTKAIFEELGLIVDEDLRRDINTAKDKADIILSLSEDEIIIGEAKTSKNGDFAKYSTTSRQVKAYATRCEAAGKRVAQVLIVAPSFSNDFVESAEMDTEVNISLLEAAGLKKILEAFKSRRTPKFSAKLFTKGGLLKAGLIAKNI